VPTGRGQACRPVEHPGRHFKPPIYLRFFQRAAEDDKATLIDGTMNAKLGDQTRDDSDKEAREERSGVHSQALLHNEARTHLALDKDAPVSRPVQRTGVVRSRTILGGLHYHYARA